MATTDLTLSVRERTTRHIVDQLVRLYQRCDEFDLVFEDCLEEAEQRFLDLVDAEGADGLSVQFRRFEPAPPIVVISAPSQVQRYRSRNNLVSALAARGASCNIASLASTIGRSVRYVHSLLREEPRTRIEKESSRVSDFRVSLRSWPLKG
jgi:hypothetical protein